MTNNEISPHPQDNLFENFFFCLSFLRYPCPKIKPSKFRNFSFFETPCHMEEEDVIRSMIQLFRLPSFLFIRYEFSIFIFFKEWFFYLEIFSIRGNKFSRFNFDKYSQKVTRDFLQVFKFNKHLHIGPRNFRKEKGLEFWSMMIKYFKGLWQIFVNFSLLKK